MTPMARRGIADVLTGVCVLLGGAGLLVYAVAYSGRPPGSGGYRFHANFEHVDGLITGADVRIAGVKVGSVLDMRVDRKSFLADVTFGVGDSIRVPKDSSAEVTSDGLLGSKFLNLTPGGDDANLPPGGTIAITQSSVSLEQLLGKFIFSASALADKGKGADSNADSRSTDNGARK